MADLQQNDNPLIAKFEGILKQQEAPQPGGTPPPGEAAPPVDLVKKFEGILSAKPAPAPAAAAPVEEAPKPPEKVPGPMGGYLPPAIAPRQPAMSPSPAEAIPDFGGRQEEPAASPAQVTPPEQPQGVLPGATAPVPGVPVGPETTAERVAKNIPEVTRGFFEPIVGSVETVVQGLENLLSIPERLIKHGDVTSGPQSWWGISDKVKEAGSAFLKGSQLGLPMSGEGDEYVTMPGKIIGGLAGFAPMMMAGGGGGASTFLQKFATNLMTFGLVDSAKTTAQGHDPAAMLEAAKGSIPSAVLFTVAQSLPFAKVVSNPYLVRQLEGLATGTAMMGASAIGGDRDPVSLAVQFGVGYGTHMFGTRGQPQQELMRRWVDKFKKDYNLSDDEFKEVMDVFQGKVKEDPNAPAPDPAVAEKVQQDLQTIAQKYGVDQTGESAFGKTPEVTTLTPEAKKEAIFGGKLGETIEGQANQADAVRALVPQIGDQARAERFYDLYQKGDADTALKEFPEMSSLATEQQKEVTPAPAGIIDQPMGRGVATETPAPGAAAPPPGSTSLPGTAAPEPTKAKAPPPEEPPSSAPARAGGGGTVGISPTPAGEAKPKAAVPEPTGPMAPMGSSGAEAENLARPAEEAGGVIIPGVSIKTSEIPKSTYEKSLSEYLKYKNAKSEREIEIATKTHKAEVDRYLSTGRLTHEQSSELGHFEAYPDLAEKYGVIKTTAPEEIAPPAVPGALEEAIPAPVEAKGKRSKLPQAIAPRTPEEFTQKFGSNQRAPEGLRTDSERMVSGERVAPETSGVSYHDNFPRDQIQLNPDVWQHKMAETGAGQALAHVKNKSQWDAQAARETSLYRYPDGHVELMDGHSRITAGDRVGVSGYGVRIYDGNVFTVEEARATAALTNIRQRTGTVVDSAKAIRDFGLTIEDLSQNGIDLNSEHTLIATGLANLSEPIFTAVAKGDFPAPKGAIIGEQLPGNPDAQEAIYRLIQKKHTDKNGNISISDEKLKNDIRFAEFSKVVPTRQPILGEEFEDFAKANLVSENSDLMTYAAKKLANEKNLFKTVSAKAQKLIEAGNKIKPKINEKISNDAAIGLAVLDKAAFVPGSKTNLLFKEFAAKLQESGNKTQVKEEFYARLPQALESDRDAAGLGQVAGAKVRGKVPAPAAPGELPTGPGGSTTKYSVKEAAPGLSAQERPTSKLETRLTELQGEYPDIDRDKASQVLRSFPKAENDQVANMVADPEMFHRMVRSGLSEAEQQKLGGAATPGRQQGLFGGGGGGLFDIPLPADGKRYSVEEARRYGPVFFSQMQNHLEIKLPGKGTGADLAKLIEGWGAKGQFKADELKVSGIIPWLREQKGTVTKQQILDKLKEGEVRVKVVEKRNFLTENESPAGEGPFPGATQFQSYLTDLPESFTNRREMLLTLPANIPHPDFKIIRDGEWFLAVNAEGVGFAAGHSEAEARQRAQDYFERGAIPGNQPEGLYRVPSAHAYGDTAADVNRFAHVFLADYVDPKTGKKFLVVTETQSDWAREGRSKGYKVEFTNEEFYRWKRLSEKIATGEFTEAERQEYRELNDKNIANAQNGPPPLPFAKSWHEVALKQAIRYAAENGYDGVMVVNGDMVKQRYDLSKKIDGLDYQKNPDGTYKLSYQKDGRGNLIGEAIPEKELENHIGKDVAAKIIEGQGKPENFAGNNEKPKIWNRLSNLDLQVGGEWANNLYDKTIPSYLKKYVKQWGAEVGKKDVETFPEKFIDEQGFPRTEKNKAESLAHFDIPDSMRDSVLYNGQPMFKATPEGQIARALTTGQIKSRLGENGTVSEIASESTGKYNRGWTIKFKNDQMAFIFESKEGSLFLTGDTKDLGPDYAAIGRTELRPGEKIAGAFRPIGLGSVIELARGEGLRTFDHESWHNIEHWLLNDKERAALARDFGDNEEVRAEAYANWKPKEAPNTVFQKILDFFQRIVKAITGKVSGEDVFAAARSGKLFGREPVERKLPAAIAPRKLKVEDEAETRQSWIERGETPSFKQFKGEMDKDNEALYQRYIMPGSREIPLYQGERFTNRAGNQIIDEKGKKRFLSKQEIYERFYDPKRPLQQPAGTEAVGRNPLLPPEGALEPPPNLTVSKEVPGKLGAIRRNWNENMSIRKVSELSDLAHTSVVRHLGWAAREMEKAVTVLGKYDKLFRNMSQEDLMAFTDKAEMGQLGQVSPELQEAAGAWRRLADGLHLLIADSKGGEFAYWRDWFPRMFKDPAQAEAVIEQFLKSHGRSMTGPEGMLKARTQLLLSQSVKPVAEGGLGLELAHDNYVDMMKAKVHESLRYLTGTYIKNDYIEAGFLQKRKFPGWVELRDKSLQGYYAHPDVARVLDNFLSKGLRGNAIFDAIDNPTSALRELFVGLSAFHGFFTTLSDLSQGVGSNLSRAIGAALTGRFDAAGHHLVEMGKALNTPGNLLGGGKLMEEYRKPGTHPELSARVDLMERGGIRINASDFSKMTQAFEDALRDSKLSLPRKMIRGISWPIMNYFVPRIKLNAIDRRLSMELERFREKEGRAPSRDEETRIAQDVSREADNIFGQMVYDNLGMKRSMRDILRIWIGFPGWNIGSGSLMLEGAKGIGHLIGQAGKAGAEMVQGRRPGYEPMTRQARVSMEFYLGMTMVTAVAGSLTMKLLTGNWPTDMKDVFMPQTGGTLPNGQPERVRMPSYMRDILSLNHPIDMVAHKTNFPIRMFSALASNQDYFGEQIRDPWATGGEQLKQTGEYLGKSFLPFGVQGMLKAETPQSKALNVVGITPVPRQYSNTPAQNIIDEYNKLTRATTTTKESAEKKKLKADLMKMARDEDQAGFDDLAAESIADGKITRQQVQEVVKESQIPAGLTRFTKLPLEWAMRAFEAGSDYEKEQWQPYILKKVMTEKPENLVKLREPLVALLKDMGLNDLADQIGELTIPEKGTRVDTTGLGILKEAPTMGEPGAIEGALEKSLSDRLAKLEGDKGKRSPVNPVARTKEKKNPYKVLGF